MLTYMLIDYIHEPTSTCRASIQVHIYVDISMYGTYDYVCIYIYADIMMYAFLCVDRIMYGTYDYVCIYIYADITMYAFTCTQI